MMAQLQMTTHTPSPCTNRQKGAVVKQDLLFHSGHSKATTMSLAHPAKKRGPGAWRLTGD